MTERAGDAPAAGEADLLLADRLNGGRLGLVRRARLVGCPHHWQVPAATEKAAFEAVAAGGGVPGATYLGFPWATLIDALRAGVPLARDLLLALAACRDALPRGARVATVAQHIHAGRLAGLFRACGVTDLFWSHARIGQASQEGMALHAFPLFPAQTPQGPDPDDPHRPRRWLANFIGSYSPRIYLSAVRATIFDDARSGAPDLHVVQRDAWHFDRAVYREQVGGLAASAAQLAAEAQAREEYLAALRDSTFTLCPTGSGPNSIRICEALALASIPVILTRDLALPGAARLWQAACLFEDDSTEGYRRAMARLRAMSAAEIRARQAATRSLFAAVGPRGYARLIAAALDG